jgi:predicted RNA binding protein with dsRBD fold (UPF0201 family)
VDIKSVYELEISINCVSLKRSLWQQRVLKAAVSRFDDGIESKNVFRMSKAAACRVTASIFIDFILLFFQFP